MIKSYSTGRVRDLLIDGFTEEELRRFCFDTPGFRPVYDQLALYTGKAAIIDKLIEHADRKLIFEPLLAWAKWRNPKRYEEYFPYHYPIIVADITVTNPNSWPVSFVIPKGQLLEIADPKLNFQNMVVSEDINVTVPPKTTIKVRVRGMCVNPGKKWPDEAIGNITPFRYDVEFSTQKDVWKAFGKGILSEQRG